MAVHSSCSPLEAHVGPGRSASRGIAGGLGLWAVAVRASTPRGLGWSSRGARLAPVMGKPRCSRIARTPPACFTARREPPPASTPHSGERVEVQRPPRYLRESPLAASSPSSAPYWLLLQAPGSPPPHLLGRGKMAAGARMEQRRRGTS